MADPSETTQVTASPPDGETAELLDAVRALSTQVGALQAEVQALRASGSTLPATGVTDGHGWDERPAARQESPPWVRALDSPGTRRPPVPQLLLEVAFLVAVAVVVTAADLDAIAIVVVMAFAWALVATAEWATARETTRREQALLRSGFAAAAVRDDASWFAPPAPSAEAAANAPAEDTAARLPPPREG